MSPTVLLVVDVQESIRHRPYWSEAHFPEFVRNLQALIDGCMDRKVPIVQIFHTEDEGVFAMNSGYIKTLAPLEVRPDVVFHKRCHSAFAGTPLFEWLKERRIRRLIVSGIRTEQCCETTARHASDSGFEVDYVLDATMTFDTIHPRTGRIVTADEIKEKTELVLSDEFARIATVEMALSAV